MARQTKRLNTNLVAFLTTMGMVLVVSIVGLVIWHGTQRDPEVLARNAREREQAGDLDKAAVYFHRAYIASEEQEPPYLLEAARCWFERGDVGNWFEILSKANANAPREKLWLVAMLEGFWKIQEITGPRLGATWEQSRRDHAAALLELEPDNPLALVSRAHALWNLRGDENISQANAAAERSFEVAPTDPRVALTRLEYAEREVRRQLSELRQRGGPQTEAQQISDQFVAAQMAMLDQAAAEHSDDEVLIATYAMNLDDQANRKPASAAAEAAALMEKAGTLLADALAARPDSAGLHLAMAQHLRNLLVRDEGQLEVEELRRRINEAENHALRAIELEPARYDAYALRADLQLRLVDDGGELRPLAERFGAALAIYEQAAADTVLLYRDNLRARLSENDRLRMLRRAFLTALQYHTLNTDPAAAAGILARAEGFLGDAKTKYRDNALTSYMEGEYADAGGDATGAIQAFERAQDKARAFSIPPAQFWAFVARVNALPSENLARLYRENRQLGEAARHAEAALVEYEQQLGRVPPARLVILRADIYDQLGQSQEALDLLQKYARHYPEDESMAAARGVVLSKLGRERDAQQQLAELGGDDVNTRFRQVQVALAGNDLAGAETTLRAILADARASADQRELAQRMLVGLGIQRARTSAADEDYDAAITALQGVIADAGATEQQVREALTLLVAALSAAERREEGQRYLQQLAAAPPKPGLERMLQTYVVLLSEQDPEARDARLLEIVAQNPDPYARAEEYVSFYLSREDYAKALEHLLDMRKLRPDDMALAAQEFRLRLPLRQFDRAAELLVQLSQYDNGAGFDRVGGAMYRAQLALVRGGREGAEEAILALRGALRTLPKNAELEVYLARACLAAGRLSEATDALERAIAINPKSFDAHVMLMATYEDRAAQAMGETRAEYEGRAAESLAQAAKLRPRHPDVLAAQERARERDHPEDALGSWEQRYAANPQDIQAVVRLARLYERLLIDQPNPETPEAVAILQKSDQLFDTAIPAFTGDEQLAVAQRAAAIYAVAGAVERGEKYIRQVRDEQSAAGKVIAQVLLAAFYEGAWVEDAAERAYQEAQRMVAQLPADVPNRRDLNLRVGQAFLEFYQRQRRATSVIEVCRWLLDRVGPDDAEAQNLRRQLIEALITGGRVSDAELELQAYVRSYGEDAAALLHQAQILLLRNDRRGAERALTRVLQADPENGWALYTRGQLQLQRGNYDAARADLTAALNLVRQPQLEYAVRDKLAGLYVRTGQLDLAEDELQAMLAMLEGRTAAAAERRQIMSRLVQLLYGVAHEFDRAQQLVSAYMEQHQDEPVWPYELGRLFETEGRSQELQARRDEQRGERARARDLLNLARQSYGAAAPYYQRAAERCGTAHPDVLEDSVVARIRVLTKAGRPRDAVAVFRNQPFFQRPTPRIRAEAAKAFLALDEPRAAQDEFAQALTEATQFSSSLGGMVAREVSESLPPPQAEALFQQVLQALPRDSVPAHRVRILLGQQLAQVGRAEAALPVLDEVLAKLPPGVGERLEALLLRARVLSELGQEAASLDTYREILKQYPDNVVALNNLAFGLVTAAGDLRRPQEALTYAERLWRIVGGTPESATILDTVGWVYHQNGQSDLAAAALEESLALESDENLAAYLHLGEVYTALGRTADARKMLRRGLEKAGALGDSEYEQKFQEQLGER